MPLYNARGARISPRLDQPYDTVYTLGRLPTASDPGWADYRHKGSGEAVRMIKVHGPFDVESGGGEQHCEDGWLAVTRDGAIFAVASGDHAAEFEAAP